MNTEQKRTISRALASLRDLVAIADAKVLSHDRSAVADAQLADQLAAIRNLAVAVEDSFQSHVGASSVLRQVRR